MAPGLFITGTDTGVGKTVLTAALLAAARHRGFCAVPMKPVQTGAEEGARGRTAPDLDFCLRMAGLAVSEEMYAEMAPYRFLLAASPHLAAQQEGLRVDLQRIRGARDNLAEDSGWVLAEGAGGILVPVNERETMLDVARALEYPAVVAARPTLGTLNHTLLTLHALHGAGIPVAGVVFVETRPTEWGVIERDNRQTIAAQGDAAVLGTIPYVEDLDCCACAPASLLAAGLEMLRRLPVPR